MRFLHCVVQRLKIQIQLPKVDGFELAFFEFHGHERVEFTVEEQEVDEVFMTRRLDTVLVADEREVLAELRDELSLRLLL